MATPQELLEKLEERFIMGEITEESYKELKVKLESRIHGGSSTTVGDIGAIRSEGGSVNIGGTQVGRDYIVEDKSDIATKKGEFCPICDSLVSDDYFTCKRCGRDYIHEKHQMKSPPFHDKFKIVCCECYDEIFNKEKNIISKNIFKKYQALIDQKDWLSLKNEFIDLSKDLDKDYNKILMDLFYVEYNNKRDRKGKERDLLDSITKKDIPFINYLLESGVDANCSCDIAMTDGITPLFYAAEDNTVDIAKILLRHGANIESKTEYGATPLFHAAREGNTEIIEFFIKHGANVNAINNSNESPLYYAIKENVAEIVDVLLRNGANPNHQSSNFNSPLLEAVNKKSSIDIVRLLLENRADPNFKPFIGESILDIANKNNCSCTRLIESYGGRSAKS